MSSVVNLPHLGESVVEGTVLKWLVRVGDRVAKDQPLVEIGTDKTDTEVVAPESGVVTAISASEGQTVKVGAALATIEAEPAAIAAVAPDVPPARAEAPEPPPASAPMPPPVPPPAARAEAPRASPAVRRAASESGIELAQVAASGPGGRLTMDDVRRASEPQAVPTPVATRSAAAPGAFSLPPYTPRPGDQMIPFTRRRRIIAEHMSYSKRTAPHVLTVAEVDVHAADGLRDKHKAAFQAEAIPLTFLSFVASATARALREIPLLNARVLDDAYVISREIHLGIAVETDDGLIVPVVRHADGLTLRGLARAIDDVATRARSGKLGPDDLAGKTFTLSNPGRKGNLFGAAIISQPNVGILRIGEIRKRVVVVERDGEDLMAIHPVMHLALSYDHRIVDGLAANTFLWRIREILETGDFSI